jgi:hypothetical protein
LTKEKRRLWRWTTNGEVCRQGGNRTSRARGPCQVEITSLPEGVCFRPLNSYAQFCDGGWQQKLDIS